jgi:endonuclease/exonuclease/phosphatase family metal-dependent hydrolase
VAPPGAIRVITFNTAVGNPRIETDQRAFLDLPFYREVIEGRPDGPILALQEVGSAQAKALRQAARSGRFRLIHIARPGQGNALLVPARFEVLSRRSHFFLGSQGAALARAIWRAVRARERLNHRQLLELRMWSRVWLRDSVTETRFSVFNTHLSGDRQLRLAQARSLMRRVHRASRHGPVILAGDLNTHPEDADQAAADASVRALFPPLEDMAPSAADPRRPAIDWVLAAGFTPVSARQYTDGSLQLPGLATAEVISDHYAKEAVLRAGAPGVGT